MNKIDEYKKKINYDVWEDMTNLPRKIFQDDDESSVLLNRPAQIDQELFKLAVNSLKSEKLAHLAINELLPLLSTKQVESATQVVMENFSNYSGGEDDS